MLVNDCDKSVALVCGARGCVDSDCGWGATAGVQTCSGVGRISHCSETSSGLLLIVILFSRPINTNSILHKILAKERCACLHRDDCCEERQHICCWEPKAICTVGQADRKSYGESEE